MTGNIIADLKTIFYSLAGRYTTKDGAIDRAWLRITKGHTEKGRHYHTLTHLADIIVQLEPYAAHTGYDTMLFATFYHDIVYNVLQHNNEEQSAALAMKKMRALHVPETIIAECNACILATKKHEATGSDVIDLFTDADMSILGRDWPVYKSYTQSVRKEYSIYPDLLYKPGRRKVLEGFLAMERIFKTAYFYDLYEAAARENVQRETAV